MKGIEKKKWSRTTALVMTVVCLAVIMTACGHSDDKSTTSEGRKYAVTNNETAKGILPEDAGTEWETGLSENLEIVAETATEGLSEYPETETEEETEQLSEYIVEMETELVYSGLIHSLDEERAAWAQNFDARNVKDLIYVTKGEDEITCTVTEQDLIQQFFDAIMQIEIASKVGTPFRDVGDMFVFEMRDGEEITFKFSMGSILLGDQMYETSNTGMLWELTGNLIEPETEEEAPYLAG